MDLKPALNKRYGKSITIELSIKPGGGGEDEKHQDTDLAPSVKDSDEPGVVKQDKQDEVARLHGIEEKLETPDEHEKESAEDEANEEQFLAQMVEKTPKSPMGGKTLQGRARDVMLARQAHVTAAKKGLKS